MIEFSDNHSPRRPRAPALRRHFVLHLALVIAATPLFVLPSSAQTLEMTKIVFRRMGPNTAPGSADAKPETIYIAGEKYTRVEGVPDPAQHTHTLIITKEPDMWLINLANHTARHILDSGPTFVARNPILWFPKKPGEPDPDKAFESFEFGNEATFFRQNSPRDLGLRKIDGKDAKAFAVKYGAREVTLFLEPETEKPLQIDVTKDGKPDVSLRYIAYEKNLPFDPALFELPEGLKITEAK